MAFDKPTRNRLASFVGKARDLITDEFTQQFQSIYGISDKGTITPLNQLRHLDDAGLSIATLLRERIEYLVRTHPDDKDGAKAAVDRLAREQAFTVLNRLAAVRMAEKRDLVVESVGKGYQSKGFKVFEQVAGSGLGDTYQRYRRYLFCLFDELAVDLGALFDRRSPQGLLFPREPALQELLKLLNAPDLETLWVEDETIGWIYQYYNDPAERKKMRDESAAPRNSRELAVRNQFFTPRYVVEFLTDNTLGRIWYEMTQGQTRLKEQCRYLVRRPTEIFLNPGDATPDTSSRDGLSQEELLKQPVYIVHRPLKDPRAIRMLDPACGSMHFGLYAFDLFESIYAEAWDLQIAALDGGRQTAEGREEAEQILRSVGWVYDPDSAFRPLPIAFPSREAFLKAVPAMIIEHNIHGIDIDPRAAQIAGLSLWLRAQRAWQQRGLRPQDRPRIRRSNIVCAEPMPGDEMLLDEFITAHLSATSEQKLLGQLVRRVFDAMKLAGEAGSLLKIEEEIAGAVSEAKQKWIAGPKMEQGRLFADDTAPPVQMELGLDVTGITDESFWEKAEERIYAALQAYAEQAEQGSGYQRRLFADDASRGFAFIDVCRKRYDVVLMNPPFGEPALSTRDYIAGKYAESKEDIYAAFVSRFAKTLDKGAVGVISNRTGFFLSGAKRWRESTLLSSSCLALLADLGDGVLDDALVEAAAYVIRRTDFPCAFFRLLDQNDKGSPLLDWISRFALGDIARGAFVNPLKAFSDFPESRISYWAPPSVREIYRTLSGANGNGLDVKFGLSTKDDYRFLRLCWEVRESGIVPAQDDATTERPWMYLAKGGEYSLHFADIHLVANWANRGREIAARVVQLYPYLNGDANWVLHTEVPYGQAGVTYTKRTTSGFSPRLLPSGCLISDLGCTVFADDTAKLPRVLAIYGSRSFGYLLEFNVASGDSVHSGSAARHYEIGTVASVPIPLVMGLSEQVGRDVVEIWRRKAIVDGRDEVSRYFMLPWSIAPVSSLQDCAVAIRSGNLEGFVEILNEASKAEDAVRRLYGFDAAAREACESEFGPDVMSYPQELGNRNHEFLQKLWGADMSEVIKSTSDALGFARFISKMTFIADRRLELLCHRLHLHPRAITEFVRSFPATSDEAMDVARDICAYSLGTAFGRWDIRFATGGKTAPELPDPFAPLPVCPPGQLQNDQGLPITKEEVGRLKGEGRWHYPIEIPWDGILVDDKGHPLDIETRVQQVLQVIWQDRWEAIEHEACEILGVKSLRDYFRKPSGFFADHLKRYSKSRRQAPIYWPLSTASGSYTLWVYYHRLTENTLHTALADFIDPKLKSVRAEISPLRESGARRDRLEELLDLEKELEDFRAEIERIIKLPWKPNLNDGVLITASPLWKLFRLPKWQKDLKACWENLSKGDYDWAHLAYTIWPTRVEGVCKTDRSIAIAHSLEHLCKVEAPKAKAKRGKKTSMPAFEGMEP